MNPTHTAPEGVDSPSGAANPTPVVSARVPRWFWAVPFFLSACLFLSGVFALFSPVPLLFFSLRSGTLLAFLAGLTNAALVRWAGGPVSLSFYTVFVLALSLALPVFLKKRKSLEVSSALTLVAMGLSAVVLLLASAQIHDVNPLVEMKNQVWGLVEYIFQSLSEDSRAQWMGDMTPEEWKRSFILEMPSAIAVFALVMVWANLLLTLRLNPGHLREKLGVDKSYLQRWKAPEILLWPTILAGFTCLWDFGVASTVGLNVFRFLMAIYAIQGLSILSFLFEIWNIRGLIRTVGYLLAVLLMMPLILSLGFFDQWFDFRAKLRQS